MRLFGRKCHYHAVGRSGTQGNTHQTSDFQYCTKIRRDSVGKGCRNPAGNEYVGQFGRIGHDADARRVMGKRLTHAAF